MKHGLLACVFAVVAALPAASHAQPAAADARVAPAQGALDSTSPGGGVPVTVGADVTVPSAYVWRGWVPVDDVVIQPSVWLKVRDVTFTAWSNFAPVGTAATFTEEDFTLDYSRVVGGVTLSAGYIGYLFVPLEDDDYTHEFYGGVSFGGPLTPSFRFYYDPKLGNGTYINAAVSHVFAMNAKGWTLAPAFSYGYTHHQWVDWSGSNDIAVTLKLSVPLRGGTVIAPFLVYSQPLNDEIGPRRFVGGLSLFGSWANAAARR